MKNTVNHLITQFTHARQARRRFLSIVLILALVVSLCVFWQLRSDGVAMANETFCGMEEHTHTEECYEQVLTCGLEESDEPDGHTHTDACYETVLTCDIPEHTHTVDCLIDDTADVEEEADWEATLPADLTDDRADNMVAIAKSQIGYTESEANFQLAEDNETRQGYTRYGAWYGNAYGDWDAMFASFCLYYAGVPESEFPEAAGAYAWMISLQEMENEDTTGETVLLADAEDYIPAAGDLVFFDTDADDEADHVGIVEEIQTQENGDSVTLKTFTVIEGDSNDAVEENTYSAADGTITGYGILPEQTEAAEAAETVEAAETTEATETAEAEAMPSTTLTFTGEDFVVSVTYDESAALPNGTQLVVSEYDKDSEVYLARYEEAAELYGWNEEVEDAEDGETVDVGSLLDIRLFDIGLLAPDEDGDMEAVEPAAPVQVTISYLSAAEEESGYMVTHFGDAAEALDVEATTEDGAHNITFDVEAFSDFQVAGVSEEDYESMPLSSGTVCSSSYFNFISSNVSGEGTVNGNTFQYVGNKVDPVSSSKRLTFDRSKATVSGSLLSTSTYTYNGDTKTILLLDCSSKCGGSSSSSYKLDDTTFENNVSGNGSTWTNVGKITFSDAGTVYGRSINAIVTVDSVRLYNSFGYDFHAYGYTGNAAANYYVGLKDKKISFGYITSAGNLDIGQNYFGSEVEANTGRYTSSYYTYPCAMDVDLTIDIQYADTGETVEDATFLQVCSDIDVYWNSGSRTQDTGRHGIFAETFKTVSGFTGDYYTYQTDLDNIYSASKGVVTAQATSATENAEGSDAGTSGTDEYTEAGIYCDTTGGKWEVSYSEGWCSTRVEVYDYATNDITIKKVDQVDQTKTLDGAGFYLYYDEEEGGTTHRYYYTGYEAYSDSSKKATWAAATWDEEKEKFVVPKDAVVLTTADGGIANAYGLPSGDYYLEEVATPDGYSVLDHVIKFTITTYGIITSEDQDVVLEEKGSLTITVLNNPGVELPKTGGAGILPFTITGIAIISAAGYFLFRNRRRKRKTVA